MHPQCTPVAPHAYLCLTTTRLGGDRIALIDNLLVRIQFIIEMIWWTGLAPSEFGSPFPGSLISTYLWLCSPSNSVADPAVERTRHEQDSQGHISALA